MDRFLGKKVDLRFVEPKPVGLVRSVTVPRDCVRNCVCVCVFSSHLSGVAAVVYLGTSHTYLLHVFVHLSGASAASLLMLFFGQSSCSALDPVWPHWPSARPGGASPSPQGNILTGPRFSYAFLFRAPTSTPCTKTTIHENSSSESSGQRREANKGYHPRF